MDERVEDKIVTILDKLNSKQYGYGIQGTYKAIEDIVKICKHEYGVDNNALYENNEGLIKVLNEKRNRINELENYLMYVNKTIESSTVDFAGKATILIRTKEFLS